jgi:hypothetical protein
MGVVTVTRELARPFPGNILAHIIFSVGGLPASAARQTPQYDARPTTKAGGALHADSTVTMQEYPMLGVTWTDQS